MFRFENAFFAYAFFIIPILIILFIWTMKWKKNALKKWADFELIKKLTPNYSKVKPVLKFIIILLGLSFLIIGIMNPQIGSKLEEVKRKGADIVIALDISNSMKAQDIQPNRLERAKQAIERLLDKLEGDRIGIVVFAGEAFVQLPITTDYAAAKLFLQNIDTDLIPTQGTAIGPAIDLSVESFGTDDGKNKTIIVITDGENHEEEAIEATKRAVEKGIIVNAIGIGSEQGTPIPTYNNGIQTGYKKDKEGNTVVTKLNEQILQEISAEGDGVYIKASNSDVGLNSILSEIKKLDKKEFESKMYTDYDDKFQYFILIALILIVFDTFILESKNRWFAKLNLFESKKSKL